MSSSTSSRESVLTCTDEENAMLAELAATLVVHNFSEYRAERASSQPSSSPLKGGKSARWKEIRKKEGLRVLQERETPGEPLALPSLLLCGSIVGSIEDVMYAEAAHSEDSARVKAFVEQDGVVDCRLLHEVAGPSGKDPFQHVQVKWQLVTEPEAVDFVVLDATGLATAEDGETIGYHLVHSVDFARLPPMASARTVKRANMSVCALFRQKTPAVVEVYARGFYDLGASSPKDAPWLLGMASRWLASFSRKAELYQMKKLAWLVRRNAKAAALDPRASSWSLSSSSEYPPPMQKLAPRAAAAAAPGRCNVCAKSFGFLGTSRRNCRCCEQLVCTRCSVSKLLVELSPSTPLPTASSCGGDRGGALVEKKRTFCSQCMADAARGNASTIAREEVLGYR